MLFLIIIMMYVMTMTVADPIGRLDTVPKNVNETIKATRRIIKGRPVGDTRPYMVYLRPASSADPKILESEWVCGGVIIHERYVLTSAACIEDAKHFYVVSGTNKWYSFKEKNNQCINNGAKKAIWKCVPKSYVFDANDFDNIRWMVGDIAVVKVEDDFNFERRIRGCDFIPKKVDYNNRSIELEKSQSLGTIAGWGSSDGFTDWNQGEPLRNTGNSLELMEADVQLLTKKNCKKRWSPRYHFVIDESMICSKDITDETMSNACLNHEVSCKELQYSDDDDSYEDEAPQKKRRMMIEPSQLTVHTSGHFNDTRRTNNKDSTGGFCENDHGGPLIIGQGKTSVVIGVMSACLTRDLTKKCYGPFLYTSVYHYRNLITCAIYKNLEAICRKSLKTETHFDWSNHIDGPAKDDTHIAHKTHPDKLQEKLLPTKPRQRPRLAKT